MGDGPEAAQSLAKCLSAARALFSHIRFLQVLNLAENAGFAWMLEIPMAWATETTSARLRLEREDTEKEEEGGSGLRVTLSLETQLLGRVRVGALLRGRRLAYQIWIEREEAVALASRSLGELNARLADGGLIVDGGFCAGLPDGLAELDEAAPLRAAGGGLVDVSI